MSKNNQKTSRFPFLSHLLPWALLLLFGAAAGYLGAMLVDRMGLTGGGIAAMVLGLAAGFFVQLVLHEGGHLAAGLAAGYGFVSFRVGSWMVIRRAGRLRLVRYRLSGTGGQCLLSPPPWREKGFPVFAYNLGGPLANLLVSALCLGGGWLCREGSPFFAAVLVGIAVMSAEAASAGAATLLNFAAAISFSLGFMNLLPIPPLDGGKLLIEILQAVFRRPVPLKVQNGLSVVGLALIGVLFVYMLRIDFMRFF